MHARKHTGERACAKHALGPFQRQELSGNCSRHAKPVRGNRCKSPRCGVQNISPRRLYLALYASEDHALARWSYESKALQMIL